MTEIVVDPFVTTGPIVGSAKGYVDGVPFRRVSVSNGEHLCLPDRKDVKDGVIANETAALARPACAVPGSPHRTKSPRNSPNR
jgi:thiamine biosynthesis protein ThiC